MLSMGNITEGEENKPLGRDLVHKTEHLSLDMARQILQTVVSTHENSITTPLDQVSGFNTQQIRDAASTVFLDLMESHNGHVKSNRTRVVEKLDVPDGHVVLQVSKKILPNGQITDQDWRLYLGSDKDGKRQLEVFFPLVDAENKTDLLLINFADFRKIKSTFLANRGKPMDIDQYRQLFKGVRWLFTNMLDWDRSGLIMPEQIDHLPLPQ